MAGLRYDKGADPPACHGRSRRKDDAPSPSQHHLRILQGLSVEMDALICNDPLGYADLILNVNPKEYLRNAAGSHGLEN